MLWKHTTADTFLGHQIVGIDLFDDDQEGHVSIYQRYEDGTRFPARTVSLAEHKHYLSVMLAWLNTGQRNFDYRKNPCYPSGVNTKFVNELVPGDPPEIAQRLETPT